MPLIVSDIRQIDLPAKDQPLRAEVRLLGALVGEVLVDQHGADLLERVEAVRKAAILQREGAESSAEGLEQELADLWQIISGVFPVPVDP